MAHSVTNIEMPTGVRGIAVLNGCMYAVLHNMSCVYVFNTQAIDTFDCIEIASDGETPNVLKWPSDIVANHRCSVLYISDRGLGRHGFADCPGMFTFYPDTKKAVFNYLDGATPAGMSMTFDNRLLVACEHAHPVGRSLRLYDVQTDGGVPRSPCKIVILDHLSKYLLQPVMFSENIFAISQIKKKNANLHRICLVDD